MNMMNKYQDIAIMALRVATALNFLSPVADRFGLWGKPGENGVIWGNYDNFLNYAAQVNSFAPPALIPFLAGAATALEVMLSILLIVGFKTRLAAVGSSGLTLLFAIAMTYSFGVKSPLDAAVFVDFSSSLLLATVPRYKWSLDEWLEGVSG